jgi:hypothetical protein
MGGAHPTNWYADIRQVSLEIDPTLPPIDVA